VSTLDAWPAAVMRELGARPRTFTTVKGALLEYFRQHTRGGRAMDPGRDSGGPVSQQRLDETQATYAGLIKCMVEHDPDVDLRGDTRTTEASIAELAAWYVSTIAQQHMADVARMSMQSFSRRCGRTERVLRRRMQAHGVLRSPGEEWSV
jgi:hypothetical protein